MYRECVIFCVLLHINLKGRVHTVNIHNNTVYQKSGELAARTSLLVFVCPYGHRKGRPGCSFEHFIFVGAQHYLLIAAQIRSPSPHWQDPCEEKESHESRSDTAIMWWGGPITGPYCWSEMRGTQSHRGCAIPLLLRDVRPGGRRLKQEKMMRAYSAET